MSVSLKFSKKYFWFQNHWG